MNEKITIPALWQMKREGRKIVGVVAWDYQMAQIVDRAGVEIVSVGDSVGINLWGQPNPLEVTMEEMIIVSKAVRRGVKRALVSVDLPFGPLQEGTESALRAVTRLVKEAGADMVKLDGAADFPETVTAITREGIPVFAQFGITPQTSLRYGIEYSAMLSPGAELPAELTAKFVEAGRQLEKAGASLLDFTHSGPAAGAAVVSATTIPVMGGLGGGPWLDGRMRMAHAAIGYAASMLDSRTETYANVARTTLDAITAYAEDVRAGRQIKSGNSAQNRALTGGGSSWPNLDALIEDLVAANRILAAEGIVDAFGHVSARHPDKADRFLLSRARSPELIETGRYHGVHARWCGSQFKWRQAISGTIYSCGALSNQIGYSMRCPQPQPRSHSVWPDGRKAPSRRAQLRDIRGRGSRLGCSDQFRRHGLAGIGSFHGTGFGPRLRRRKLHPDARARFYCCGQINPRGCLHGRVSGSKCRTAVESQRPGQS